MNSTKINGGSMFKISRRVVGLWLCFQFLTLTSSFSFEDVTGKWNCNGKGLADEDVQFVLELKQSGETVTGTVTIMGGDRDPPRKQTGTYQFHR
jgi:hypothetical protein